MMKFIKKIFLRIKAKSLNSLKNKILGIIVLLSLIPIIITGYYFYNSVSSILYGKANDKIDEFTNTTNTLIYSRFEDINNTFFIIMNDETINKLYSLNPEKNPTIDTQLKNTVDKRMTDYLNFNYVWKIGLVESVVLYIHDENYYHRISQSYPFAESGDIKVLYEKHKLNTSKFELLFYNGILYYIRDFNDLNSGMYSGTLIFAINEGVITKEYNKVLGYKGVQVMIYDKAGIIISHTDKTLLGKIIPEKYMEIEKNSMITKIEIGGEKYLAASNYLDDFNLSSLILIPIKSAYSDMPKAIYNYMLIIFLIMMITLLIGIFLSSTIIKHINGLIKNMEKVQNGNYTVRMRDYKEKDLLLLSNIFNGMVDHINYLINKVYKNQILLKEAELKSLQGQINPHFLFNILFCIGSKAKMSNNETVYKMISSLSELMYASIYSDSSIKNTIEYELKNVEFYLYLQKERFGDKINIDLSGIDESVKEFYIPKFCIQTIVENAIVHGLENKLDKGTLTLNAYIKVDSIYFEVIDDGVGFNTNSINFDGTSSFPITKNNHLNIGLLNTKKRLELLYGDPYGITVESTIGLGTKVIIKIPVDRGDY